MSFFGIQNEVYQVKKNEIKYLNKYFIALVKDNHYETINSFFTFVETNDNKYRYIDFKTNKWQAVSDDKFIGIFQEVVLIVKPNIILSNRTSNENNSFFRNSKFSFIALIVIIAFSIIEHRITLPEQLYVFSIILFSSIGIYLSYEAILLEIGIPSKNIDDLCNTDGENKCKNVIISNNWVSKYISINKTSFTYFIFQFLFIFFSIISNNDFGFYFYILSILHFLSLPIVVLSLMYQKYVVKQYCKICILISTVLLFQICLSFLFLPSNFTIQILKYQTILNFIVSIIFSISFANLIKFNLKYKMITLRDRISNLRIRKNLSLFKLALKNSKRYNSKDIHKSSLNFESSSAQLNVLLIISPTCGHCKESIETLYKLWKESDKKFNLYLNFNIDIYSQNTELLETHIILTNIFLTNSSEYFIDSLLVWYSNRDIIQLKSRDIYNRNIDLIYKYLNEQYKWNYSNNIFNTPKILINEFEYPDYYDRKDIKFYLFDLVESFE